MLKVNDVAARLRGIAFDMDPDDMDKELFMEAAFMLEEYTRFVGKTFRDSYILNERWG